MASPANTFPSIGRAQSPRNLGRWVPAVTGTASVAAALSPRFWIDRRLEFRAGADSPTLRVDDLTVAGPDAVFVL